MRNSEKYIKGEVLYPEDIQAFYVFADIRGFTEWSSANLFEVDDLLRIAYSLAFKCFGEIRITKNLKRVVKFLGDGFFAVNEYGKNISPDKFLVTLLKVLENVEHYRAGFKEQIRISKLHDKKKLSIGFGVSYGKSKRFHLPGFPKDYVGDRINLAARLCSEAAPLEIVLEPDLKEYLIELKQRQLIRIQHYYDKEIEIKGFGRIEAYTIDRGLHISKRVNKFEMEMGSDQAN